MAKLAPLSETAQEILDFLTEQDEPMTLADIKEVFPNANSAHLTALRNRGLVDGEKVEKEVVTVSTRKVFVYNAVDVEDEPAEEDAE